MLPLIKSSIKTHFPILFSTLKTIHSLFSSMMTEESTLSSSTDPPPLDPLTPTVPISYPLKTLTELQNRTYFNSFHYPFNKSTVELTNTCDDVEMPRGRKLLVCHDMAGGYTDDDKWVQGGGNAEAYGVWHWYLIDVFVYFSHSLVTLPPPCWVNAAHKHGVKVLGTFIMEWDEGKALADELLASKSSAQMYAERLSELAIALGFDGWLINMEVNLDPGQIPNLKEFVSHLSNTMHSSLPGSLVIWYDSVTIDGDLTWQNQLNDKNKPFFDVCDGIFVNYTWQENYPKLSADVAGERKFDVYMGIDVFGRGTYGGGQWTTNVALDVIKKNDVSAALFAPGWVYETNQPPDFQTAQNRWWGLVEKSWGTVQKYPKVLPFYSNFDQGHGYHISVDGKQISNSHWNNISSQSFQPFIEYSEDSTAHPIQVSINFKKKSYNGGGNITFSGNLGDGAEFTARLFQGELFFGNSPVHFTYSVKSRENSLFGLAIEFSSATQEKKSVFLAAPGNALLTMNLFSRRFTKVIMPRQVTKIKEHPGWVIQDSSIEMDGHTLKEIHAVCYRSQPQISSSIHAVSGYHAVLGDIKISTTAETLCFPPSNSWLVDAQFVSWSSGSNGTKHVSIKIDWKLNNDTSIIYPKYNIYVKKLKSLSGNESEATKEVAEYLGVAVVNTFYVSELEVPSGVSSVEFIIQVCGVDGVCQKLELSPSYLLPVQGLALTCVLHRTTSIMDVAESDKEEIQSVLDEQEYASQSKLLLEFLKIPSFDRAWCFQSETGNGTEAMFVINQPSVLANKKRKSLLTSHIVKEGDDSVKFRWAPFPVELTGVSALAPSPSGSKLLVVRNSENDSLTHFEIWGSAELKKDFAVSSSIHGSVYSDGWFEGISWSSDETLVAYVAEEPNSTKPKFNCSGYAKDGREDCGSWKGQGDWEEDWGESYAGKRQPTIFVIDVESGEVCPVPVKRSLSIGQVVWAPSVEGQKYLVFVGWPSKRKFGIKYCYNRPCALYAVKAPSFKSEISVTSNEDGDQHLFNLTESISSAFFPRFRPDDKSLVFLSAKSAVDSGAHMATDSLHKIDWPSDGNLGQSFKIIDVVPVVMCPENGCFPGIYCTDILSNPWLTDGHTMILSSVWGSAQAILSINVLSGKVSRVSPKDSYSSWNVLALKDDDIIAECSSPIDIPQIKYGSLTGKKLGEASWNWMDVLSPLKCSETAMSHLASMKFTVMKIPVRGISVNLAKGASNPFEAIFVSSLSRNPTANPLIVILHGGPHDVSLSSFSKTSAFLCSLGFDLLIVNYRGSWGFGEEALQSLPGNVGSQDVNDVLTAIDHVTDKGLVDPSKIAVVGISHGGFLATHLIGQAPGKFAAAAARNPVCNFALMVGTSDIPDWCYVNVYGDEGKSNFIESPSAEHLAMFYSKSPISHISKVKTPTLFLLGARDVRVPMYDGLQYARALRDKGVETKVIVFPNDIHPINRPQSDFGSFLHIGVWFNKHCKILQ